MRRVTMSSGMSSCLSGIISTFSIIYSCDTFVNTFTSSSLTAATQSALKYSVPTSQSSSVSFSGKQSLSVPSTYKITRSFSHYDGFLSNLFSIYTFVSTFSCRQKNLWMSYLVRKFVFSRCIAEASGRVTFLPWSSNAWRESSRTFCLFPS